MTTLRCSKQDYYDALVIFRREIANRSNSQESIGNLHKGLVLHYLGLMEVADSELEFCANTLKGVTHEAIYRGWLLLVPDLSAQEVAPKREGGAE